MDDGEMSGARLVGVCLALVVAYFMASNLTVALHEVIIPMWPGWVCLVLGISVTLGSMLFILTGVAHVFFEGIVIWVLVGSMSAYMASMPVSFKAQRLERVQQKQIQQQKEKEYRQQLDQEAVVV